MTPLAAALAVLPGVAERLAADHVDDGTGHCRVCVNGGQSGRSVWPCTLRSAADAALGTRPETRP
ncbi:hypothetical protein ACQEVB_03620 [Pseudonocardia sp. CA-107938]|uniref:hypothetical protein n=1 Tax=Pseudonocardia sp. CA-107938 TaxID=3240021 RepID=UPI003D8FD4B0